MRCAALVLPGQEIGGNSGWTRIHRFAPDALPEERLPTGGVDAQSTRSVILGVIRLNHFVCEPAEDASHPFAWVAGKRPQAPASMLSRGAEPIIPVAGPAPLSTPGRRLNPNRKALRSAREKSKFYQHLLRILTRRPIISPQTKHRRSPFDAVFLWGGTRIANGANPKSRMGAVSRGYAVHLAAIRAPGRRQPQNPDGRPGRADPHSVSGHLGHRRSAGHAESCGNRQLSPQGPCGFVAALHFSRGRRSATAGYCRAFFRRSASCDAVQPARPGHKLPRFATYRESTTPAGLIQRPLPLHCWPLSFLCPPCNSRPKGCV